MSILPTNKYMNSINGQLCKNTVLKTSIIHITLFQSLVFIKQIAVLHMVNFSSFANVFARSCPIFLHHITNITLSALLYHKSHNKSSIWIKTCGNICAQCNTVNKGVTKNFQSTVEFMIQFTAVKMTRSCLIISKQVWYSSV